MRIRVLIGRMLFSWIFLMAIITHFKPAAIAWAASKGVPAAGFFVPVFGVVAFIGGLSISLGYLAKVGGWLIVLFLVPVTFSMHAFWRETDPMQTQIQMSSFMKNMALLGGALLITWFGAGPLSIDEWQAAKRTKQNNS